MSLRAISASLLPSISISFSYSSFPCWPCPLRFALMLPSIASLTLSAISVSFLMPSEIYCTTSALSKSKSKGIVNLDSSSCSSTVLSVSGMDLLMAAALFCFAGFRDGLSQSCTSMLDVVFAFLVFFFAVNLGRRASVEFVTFLSTYGFSSLFSCLLDYLLPPFSPCLTVEVDLVDDVFGVTWLSDLLDAEPFFLSFRLRCYFSPTTLLKKV